MSLKTKATVLFFAIILLLFGIGGFVSQAQAAVAVNIGFFYEQLASYGTWVEVPTYGWVWYPRGVSVGWSPYTLGRWVDTDDYGWMWASDEDWGWATYHYGRWLWTDEYGWVWIPGYIWGPAWVAWRIGGGYIGWYPLPPQVGWRAGVGLVFGRFDIDRIPPQRWIFVRDGDFLAPEIHRDIIIGPRNVTIVKRTKNVTKIVPVDGRIANRSVPVKDIERVTGKRVRAVRVAEVGRVGDLRAARHAGEVAVFRPKVERPPANVTPRQFQTLEGRHKAERATLEEQQKAERANLGRHHAIDQQGAVREERVMRQHHGEDHATLQEKQRAEVANLQKRQKLEGRASSFGQEEQHRAANRLRP